MMPVAVILFGDLSAHAQNSDPFLVTEPTQAEAYGEVTSEPVCFNLINTAPYTVYGTIKTNEFMRPDGIKTSHRSNFRLEPEYEAEFCSSGPFFDDRKLEIILRTLVPIFNCKTKITGDIVIHGQRTEDGTKTWINCIE